jgi:Fic family protein
MEFVGYLIVVVIAIWIGRKFAVRRMAKGGGKIKYSKADGKQKILQHLAETRAVSISNNEVEKMLNVSDATATRYLDELEQEGKVEQMGRTGKYVTYRLK